MSEFTSQFLSPQDLKKITDDAEVEDLKAEAAKRLQADRSAAEMKRTFESRELDPKAPERINQAVRAAALRGAREVLVLRFPATFCKDGGRRINNFEADWPDSLTGFGRTAFEFYENELRALGFTMRAEIMSFPEGNLGDVGLYLRW
jgi:hypothetical protein